MSSIRSRKKDSSIKRIKKKVKKGDSFLTVMAVLKVPLYQKKKRYHKTTTSYTNWFKKCLKNHFLPKIFFSYSGIYV